MKRTVIGAAVLALGISTIGVAAADKPGDDDTTKTSKTTQSRDCGDGDVVTLSGSDTLWPPNHKMVEQLATATDGGSATTGDDASNATTLTITPTMDEVVNGTGDGNTDADWNFPQGFTASGDPTAQLPFEVRAERSGRGDGRVYTFDWVATFDGTRKTCSSQVDGQLPFTVFVPHDQGKGNDS